MAVLLLASIFACLSVHAAAEEISISAVTVLLPHYNPTQAQAQGVQYPLEAYGGCFSWSSPSSHIVSITPDPNTVCFSQGVQGHKRVLISATPSTDMSRKNAWVIAEEISSGDRAECEVFFDRVHRMEILTSTKHIYVGDLETLQVQAFDDQHNVFTSLEGMRFNWLNSAGHLLDPMRFSKAGIEVSETRRRLEQNGWFGDRIPVKGVQPGRAMVTAVLLDGSQPVETQVELRITEPLYLKPTLEFIAPATEIAFELKTRVRDVMHPETPSSAGVESVKQGSTDYRIIHMPSHQYKWNSTASDIVRVNRDLGIAYGLTLGKAKVAVTDVQLPEHRRDAEIRVVEPTRLELQLGPIGAQGRARDWPDCRATPRDDPTWFITHESQHGIRVLVLDAHRNQLLVTRQFQFQVDVTGGAQTLGALPLDPMQLVAGARFGELRIRGAVAGEVTLTVTLASIEHPTEGLKYDISPPLVARVRIVVVPPLNWLPQQQQQQSEMEAALQQRPSELVLPFTGPMGPFAEFHVKAMGGSGRYQWLSSYPNVIGVVVSAADKSKQFAGIIARGERGTSQLTLKDECNPDDSTQLTVHVSAPAMLSFSPGPVEVTLQQSQRVTVRLADAEGRSFHNCSALRAAVTISEGQALAVQESTALSCFSRCPDLPSPSSAPLNCFHANVKALLPGFARLTARLLSGASGPVPSPASLLMSAYAPLRVDPGHIVLAHGAQVNVTWTGGPLPWPAEGSDPSFEPLSESSSHQLYSRPTHWQSLTLTVVAHRPGSWATGAVSGSDASSQHPTEEDPTRRAISVFRPNEIAGFGPAQPLDTHRFSVACQDVASESLALEVRVGNVRTGALTHPALSRLLVRLDCFPRLVLQPERLILGVGSKKDAIVRLDPSLSTDHPMLGNLTFATGDDKIATVSSTGLVTGLSLGETPLVVYLSHPALPALGPDFTAQTPLPARFNGLRAVATVVVQFEGFVIRTPKPFLLERSEMVLHLEGINGELPADLSFDSVDCEWSTDAGLSLNPLGAPTEDRRVGGKVFGLSIEVTAERVGRFGVFANVTVRGRDHTDAPQHFSAMAELQVFERLELLTPASLFLPPGAHTELRTTLDEYPADLSYTVLQAPGSEPVVTVDARGGLRAGTQAGDALVLVTWAPSSSFSSSSAAAAAASSASSIEPPRQSVSVQVTVTPPRKLVLANAAETAAAASASASTSSLAGSLRGPLCVGSNVTVAVALRSDLGREFSALRGYLSGEGPYAALRVRSSRPQILKVHKLAPGSDGTDKAILLTLSAVGTFPNRKYGLSVIRIALNQSDDESVPPLYLRVHVADSAHCVEPVPARVTFVLRSEAGASLPVPHSSGRSSFEARIKADVARALKTNDQNLRLVSICPKTGEVSLDLLPSHWLAHVHPGEWHLREDGHLLDDIARPVDQEHEEDGSGSSGGANQPLEWAQALQSQAARNESVLRHGDVTRFLDGSHPLRISLLGHQRSLPREWLVWRDERPPESPSTPPVVVETQPTKPPASPSTSDVAAAAAAAASSGRSWLVPAFTLLIGLLFPLVVLGYSC